MAVFGVQHKLSATCTRHSTQRSNSKLSDLHVFEALHVTMGR